jgi:hypothetical protein
MRSPFLALVVAFALGCKGDPVRCEKACRNYAELVYWAEADAEIEKAPPEKRDELRKQKLAEFARDLERGIDVCTSKCLSANNDADTDCLINAKTAKQAKACVTD